MCDSCCLFAVTLELSAKSIKIYTVSQVLHGIFCWEKKIYIVALRKGLFGSNMIKQGRVSGGSSLSSAASRSFLPTAQGRNVLSRRGFVFHVGWWSLRWGKRGPPRQICKGQVIISNERHTGIFFMTLSLLNLPPVLNMNDLVQPCVPAGVAARTCS